MMQHSIKYVSSNFNIFFIVWNAKDIDLDFACYCYFDIFFLYLNDYCVLVSLYLEYGSTDFSDF